MASTEALISEVCLSGKFVRNATSSVVDGTRDSTPQSLRTKVRSIMTPYVTLVNWSVPCSMKSLAQPDLFDEAEGNTGESYLQAV